MARTIRYDLRSTTLVVYDSKLFGVNNQIGRWAHRLKRRYHANAIRYAPVNKRQNKSTWGQLAFYSAPGALKAAIALPGAAEASRIGVRHWDVTLTVRVPYAAAVFGGTTGPITAKTYRTPPKWVPGEYNAERVSTGLPYMVLPGNAAFGGYRSRVRSVRGQKAHKGLDHALAATSRHHPSVKGGFRKSGYRSFG